MKTKFSRILGIALTLAMVASLFVFAVPAAAQPGNTQWDAQTLPTATSWVLATGTDVTEVAISGDGSTIYAINGLVNMNVAVAPWALFKSTDAGQSFTEIDLSGVTGALATPLGNVAIAPDNPDCVAISTRDATAGGGLVDTVFITSNGGITWAALPDISFIAVATNAGIQDLVVGPARSGTLLGREYLVALADDAAGFADGDVQIIGATAAWVTVDAVNVAAGADYMACAFSPSFVGDRTVVAVGANAAGSILHIVNTASSTQVRAATVLNAAVRDFAVAVVGILAADIALPTDFAPLIAEERVYASTASTAAANDGIYRVDEGVRRELGMAGTTFTSVAYNGTVDEGILFAGHFASTTVRWTANPTVGSPTWKATKKVPTGAAAAGRTFVRLAADYATSEEVFAGTSGAESALSLSNNAGLSFNQESLIDSVGANTVVTVDDIALTPDGGTIFVASDDGAQLSLWKSTTPVSATSWSRIYSVTAAGPGIVRLNPEWDTDPVLYFMDTAAGGALAGVNNVFLSRDGGDIFSIRSSPVAATLIRDAVVEDALVLHVGQATNTYKSINAGWTYGSAVPALAGVIVSLASPVADHLLVGGTGAASYSTDGAATFTDIAATAGQTYIVSADEDYATNNTFYAGCSNNLIYRFVIGTDTSLASLANPTAAALVGVAMSNGVLYGMSAASADRTLWPQAAIGNQSWETMNIGGPAAASFSVADNVLYAAPAAAALWAYDDWLATTVLVPNAPADGFAVGVDPVNGRAEVIGFSWQTLGTGTGLVMDVEIQIAPQGTNFGAPLIRSYSSVATLTGLANTMGMNPTNPVLLVGTTGQWVQNLKANTIYEWRIRARDTIARDTIRSPWSEARVLNIQAGGAVVAPQVGPILQGPVPGATGVSLTPGFSWAAISGTTEYEFILATDFTLTDTVEGTPVLVNQPSWQVPAGTLEYGTDYFWGVKSTQPTESPQSIGTFRTMISELYECPFCSETFTTAGALESHIAAMHPAATPAYIWAIIVIGAVLMIAVIMLIVKTRRVA